MREQLITFETAKLAKDRGFNIHCRWYFDDKDGTLYENEDFPYNSWNGSLFAPTQSLLQKWLRDRYGIHIDIRMIEDEEDYEKITWSFQIVTKNLFGDVEYGDFNSYEEALERALFQTLNLLPDANKTNTN